MVILEYLSDVSGMQWVWVGLIGTLAGICLSKNKKRKDGE